LIKKWKFNGRWKFCCLFKLESVLPKKCVFFWIFIDHIQCYGNPLFKRYAQDMDYLCQFKKEHKYLYYLWQYSSNFGQSLLLWAGWSFLLAILFATVFYFMGTGCFYINPHKVGNLPFDFLTMSYYSIVTFTTLGFGDVTPITRTAAFLVTFEVIFGYIMLGGLISIFANKLARRS